MVIRQEEEVPLFKRICLWQETGLEPITVESETRCERLNVDMLDDKHYSDISAEIDSDISAHSALIRGVH